RQDAPQDEQRPVLRPHFPEPDHTDVLPGKNGSAAGVGRLELRSGRRAGLPDRAAEPGTVESAGWRPRRVSAADTRLAAEPGTVECAGWRPRRVSAAHRHAGPDVVSDYRYARSRVPEGLRGERQRAVHTVVA